MKILGTLLVILGILKGLTIKNLSITDITENESKDSELPINPTIVNNTAKGLFILEVALEIVCGLFIVFL